MIQILNTLSGKKEIFNYNGVHCNGGGYCFYCLPIFTEIPNAVYIGRTYSLGGAKASLLYFG